MNPPFLYFGGGMADLRIFPCPLCGTEVRTADRRKMFCSKRCADRSRNVVMEAPPPDGRTYSARSATQIGAFDYVSELRFFSKLTNEGKRKVLLGEEGTSIVMFDIEATHLKPNVGRILCCSFKPLGGEVYTFGCTERRFKEPDVYDDGKLASAIIDELEKYDIIVGWNSKQFDTKFINARAVRTGGRTKSPQYQIDGMWAWKSKVSAWAGLDSVQKFALPDADTTKTSVEWQKWMQALGWDAGLRKAAMDEIIDHCERDVVVLEDVYRRLVEANMIRSIRKDGGVM